MQTAIAAQLGTCWPKQKQKKKKKTTETKITNREQRKTLRFSAIAIAATSASAANAKWVNAAAASFSCSRHCQMPTRGLGDLLVRHLTAKLMHSLTDSHQHRHTRCQPVRDLIQVQLINFFVVLYGKSCRVCWLFASSGEFSHREYKYVPYGKNMYEGLSDIPII